MGFTSPLSKQPYIEHVYLPPLHATPPVPAPPESPERQGARGERERGRERKREREKREREGEMPRQHVKKILIIRAPPHAATSVLRSKSIPSAVLCGRPL